jgi:hypothetical protein
MVATLRTGSGTVLSTLNHAAPMPIHDGLPVGVPFAERADVGQQATVEIGMIRPMVVDQVAQFLDKHHPNAVKGGLLGLAPFLG